MLARLAIAATAGVLRMRCWNDVAGYFFLLCCRLACSLCRAPDVFDPAPIEKEGVAGDPKQNKKIYGYVTISATKYPVLNSGIKFSNFKTAS